MIQGEQLLVCSNCCLENLRRTQLTWTRLNAISDIFQCQLWNWNGLRWTTPCLQQLQSGKSRMQFTWT